MKKTKYIIETDLEKYINDGWVKGSYVKPDKIHKIAVYNDIVNKIILIDPQKYAYYYDDGWSLNLPHHKSNGKIIVRNETTRTVKYICKDELEKYLSDGWKKGRFKNKRKRILRNKNNLNL